MKMKNIISAFLSGAVLLGFMVGCQDEVIVKVEDTATADSLLAEIADLENQYLTLDAENGTLTIENIKLERALDSLYDVRYNFDNPYSQPSEVHFTLNVLSASSTVFSGRSQGVEGATVTLTQNGLAVSPDASSAAGLYLFKGLREGQAYVTVTAPDHTPVEFTVYFDRYNGEDVADADSYNASAQVILFGNAGSAAGTLSGKAYANLSTLNDTLGYKYGSDALVFEEKANTYITAPGIWNFSNYTQDDDYFNYYNLYDGGSGTNIQWENALAGQKIYSIPSFNNVNINNDSENGWITGLIYKNVITSATIAADGTFSLPILAGNTYDENQLIDGTEITADEMVTGHTRFTRYGGNYYGQEDEVGSTDQTFTFYNRNNFTVGVYEGDDLLTFTNVDPGKTLDITRKKITQTYAYYMFLPNGRNGWDNDNYLDAGSDDLYPSAGETKIANAFFFPIELR